MGKMKRVKTAKEKVYTIVYKAPGQVPEVRQSTLTLDAQNDLVRGSITTGLLEAFDFYEDVFLVGNDNAYAEGEIPNVRNVQGHGETIAGPVFVMGCDENGKKRSLTEEEQNIACRMFDEHALMLPFIAAGMPGL